MSYKVRRKKYVPEFFSEKEIIIPMILIRDDKLAVDKIWELIKSNNLHCVLDVYMPYDGAINIKTLVINEDIRLTHKKVIQALSNYNNIL